MHARQVGAVCLPCCHACRCAPRAFCTPTWASSICWRTGGACLAMREATPWLLLPGRQRTLRELEVGRTLVKEGDRQGPPPPHPVAGVAVAVQGALATRFAAASCTTGVSGAALPAVWVMAAADPHSRAHAHSPARPGWRRSWLIRHGPGDYKTGKLYGERPPLVLLPFLYPELEAFLSTWRAGGGVAGSCLCARMRPIIARRRPGGKQLATDILGPRPRHACYAQY